MDFSHYKSDAGDLAVDLVNTLDPVSGDDSLTDIAALERFVADHSEESLNAEWYRDDLTEEDLREVLALRERLREVFHSENDVAAADRINRLLEDSAATPRVSLHGGTAHLHFEAIGPSLGKALGAATAMGLGVVLVEEGFERLGFCDSSTCEDVYIDVSKNRTRRYCGDTCSTREAVAAYRRRAREA